MKIKPITIVCDSAADAVALVGEYRWIGRDARADGRCVRVLTSTVEEWDDAL